MIDSGLVVYEAGVYVDKNLIDINDLDHDYPYMEDGIYYSLLTIDY